MSAYPSLLSPLMDTTGLIATASLNTLAQTALAAGTYASAEVDVLKITALQESGNVYTGLPTTSMVIDSDIRATEFRITNAKLEENKLTLADGQNLASLYASGTELWTDSTLNVSGTIQANTGFSLYPIVGNALLECYVPSNSIKSYSGGTLDGFGTAEFATVKATQASGTVFQNNDASFLVDFEGNATVKQLNYTSLNPAFPAEVIPTLSQVLTAGNDAGTQNIIGVGTINAVVPQFKPTYDYYVSKGGLDTGLGSVLSPYLTVQKAIDECQLVSAEVPKVIHVSAGTFTENLVITKSDISIVGAGSSSSYSDSSSIVGTIVVGITSGNQDMNNNNVYFSNMTLIGEFQDTTVNFPHRLFFTDCYLYATGRCLLMNITGDYRLFVDRCNISNESTTAINSLVQCLGTGMVSITNTKMTAKGGQQIVCNISVSCRVDTFASNILTSDSSSLIASEILYLGTSATVSIGNCGFIYSNSAVKGNATSAGIRMNSTGSLVIVQSFFSLAGLPAGSNAIQNTGLGVVIFGNLISTSSPAGTSASGISGALNQTKFSMTSVQ